MSLFFGIINKTDVKVTTAKGKVFKSDQVIITTSYQYSILNPELFRESGFLNCKLNMISTRPFFDIDLKSIILTGLSIRKYTSFHEAKLYKLLPKDDVNSQLKAYGIHILFKQEDLINLLFNLYN